MNKPMTPREWDDMEGMVPCPTTDDEARQYAYAFAREYAAYRVNLAVRAALEEAAQLCDDWMIERSCDCGELIAPKIRALMPEVDNA